MNIVSHNLNVQFVCYSTGWKIKYFIVYRLSLLYFSAAEYANGSGEYINRTQKHENRNWDYGRAVPFLGIYVSNFRYSIFAVNFKYF